MDNISRQYTAYPTSPLTNNNYSLSSPQYYNNTSQYNSNSTVVAAPPLSPSQQLTTARQYNTYTGGHQYQPPQVQRQAPLLDNSVSPQIIPRGTLIHDNRKLLAPIREEYTVSKYIKISSF